MREFTPLKAALAPGKPDVKLQLLKEELYRALTFAHQER
jgi:hypothetical protein